MYRERAGLGGWLGGICRLYSLPGRVEPIPPPPRAPPLDLLIPGSRGLACAGPRLANRCSGCVPMADISSRAVISPRPFIWSSRCCAQVPAGHRRGRGHSESGGGFCGWVCVCGGGRVKGLSHFVCYLRLQSDMQSHVFVRSDLTSEINFRSASPENNLAVIGNDSAIPRPNPGPACEATQLP